MLPLLFQIPLFGGIRIYTYGVMIALAFIAGILWTFHEARLAGRKMGRDQILDLSFYIILAALAGARLFYIFIDWERYAAHPLDILKIWEGGLVYYGGLIAAIVVSFIYVRRHQLSFLYTADLFAPAIALGYAFARVGCFSAGCCYGRVVAADSFFAVVFPDVPYGLAPPGIPLFATQLVALASTLVIFALLILIRRRQRFTGQVFLSYLILYGIARTILEYFRASDVTGPLMLSSITRAQFISLFLILAASLTYMKLNRRSV